MSDIDLDAIGARARDWRDYRAGKELVLALIARVREQEQEIAELRKRPVEEEVLDALCNVTDNPSAAACLAKVAALYAEKARA